MDTQTPASFGDMFKQNLGLSGAPTPEQASANLGEIAGGISGGIAAEEDQAVKDAESVQVPVEQGQIAPTASPFSIPSEVPPPAQADDGGASLGFDMSKLSPALQSLQPPLDPGPQDFPQDPMAPPTSIGSFIMQNLGGLFSAGSDKKKPAAPHPEPYEAATARAREGVSTSGMGEGWKLDKATQIKALTPFYQGTGDLAKLAPPALAATYDFVAAAQAEGYKPIITSGYRPGDPGYHGYGEGIDVAVLDKKGKMLRGDAGTALMAKWARRAGWATMLNEADHPIPGHTTGEHYHLAWGTDAKGLPGATQLVSRNPSDKNYLAPNSGKPVDFKDAVYLVGKADLKTIPGKAARAAELSGLDVDIFTRQIQAESGFEDVVNSETGARGWAQFMPATAAERASIMGVDLQQFYSNPLIQLKGAAGYMKDLAKMFGGDMALASAAYNWGPGMVQSWLDGRAKMPSETKEYIHKIYGERYPSQLPSPDATEAFLRSRVGPKVGQAATVTERQQYARDVAHPVQKVVEHFFPGQAALAHMGADVIKSGVDKLPEGNIKSAAQAVTGFTVDTDQGKAELGLPAVIKDATSSFINHFLWGASEVGKAQDSSYNRIMSDFAKDHPVWNAFGNELGRHGLPMLAGMLASTEVILGMGGALPGAAGRFFSGSKRVSNFMKGVEQTEAGLSGVLGGLRGWYTANGGAASILRSSLPLGLAVGLDAAGRTAIAMEKAGIPREEIIPAALHATINGLGLTLGLNVLAPLGGQVLLGSVLRSPEAAGAMGEIFAKASPVGKQVMKASAGAITGVAASQVANFTASLFGQELDISPQAGAAMGVTGAFALQPAAWAARGLLQAAERANPAGMAASRDMFTRTWKSLNQAYEHTGTDEIIENAKEISHKFAAAERNLAAADRWVELNKNEAAARTPGIETMENQGKILESQLSSITQQKELVNQGLKELDAQMSGSPIPKMYESAQKVQAEYQQKLAALEQKKAQAASDPSMQDASARSKFTAEVQSELKQIKEEKKLADEFLAKVPRDHPEVIRIADQKQKLQVLEGAERDAKQNYEDFQKYVGPILSAEKRLTEAQLAEAARVEALPIDVKADPSFDLAFQNKLLDFQHGVGEVPSIAGVDPKTVAQLADHNFHQSIRSITNRLQTESDRIWDKEYNLKGRQVARAAALREGSASDLFVAQKWQEYNKVATTLPDDLAKAIYQDNTNGYYSRGQAKFNEILNNQALKWDESQFARAAGARAKAKTNPTQTKAVRASYIIKAAEDHGYDIENARTQINTTRSKGLKQYLDVQKVTADGKDFVYKKKEYKAFEPSPELLRQALAAESVGDTWVPITHDLPEGGNVEAYIKHLRQRELKEVQAQYAQMAKDVLGYAADRQEQIILHELYGGKGTLEGGETVISEVLHPEQLKSRIMQRLAEKDQSFIGPRQATPADHIEEMRNYIANMMQKDPAAMQPLVLGALSEEMQLLSTLGEGLAGGSKNAEAIPAKGMQPVESPDGIPIAMSEDGMRKYIIGKSKEGKPEVLIAKRRYVASSSDITKLALGLEGFKPSATVASFIDLVKGNNPLSDQAGRIVFTKQMQAQLKALQHSSEPLTEIEVKGATGQRFVETQGKAQRVSEELALDLDKAVTKGIGEAYEALPDVVREKNTQAEFIADVVDMIEDVSMGPEIIRKYGESARQMATDILEVTKAINQVRTSSAWADKTSRSSYFFHQFPSLREHILTMYGDGGSAGLSVADATEGAMRDFDTLKQVRDFARSTRDNLTGIGIDPKDFINMTPAQRVEKFYGSKVDITQLSREQMARNEAKVNKMAHSLIMDGDTRDINPGKVLSNKLRSVYHQEGTRQMLELLMRTKTLGTVGRDGMPATLLYHAKDSNTARIVETPNGAQAYKRLNQNANFGSTEVKLFGESYKTGDLMMHPEAFKYLNNYAGSVNSHWAWKAIKDVVAFVNQTNLLGGIPAHLFQTMEAVMGETMAGFYAGAGKMLNLAGAGRRIRQQGVSAAGDGRFYELYAIRHGLNAKSLANTSFDIAETALSTLGSDFAGKTQGLGDTNVHKFFQVLDPRNPVHTLARQHLKGLWGAGADFMSTPIQMEQALQRHLTFQSIRDAQVAAFYARAGHFMDNVPELAKITDPSARFSAALRASAEVANQQAGAIPYHRLNKWIREAGQGLQMTPGWFFTQANAVVETMQALGYWSLGPLRQLSPETAVRLRKLGHKVGIGKRHPDLPPEVAGAVRERIVRNVAGVALASTLFAETFNVYMNGRTSYQEADGSAFGKLVVGNSTFSVPFFGYVRRLQRLLHKGGAIAAGKSDDSMSQVIWDEIAGSLSPLVTGLAPMLAESNVKERMASNMESEPTVFQNVPVLGGAERMARQATSGLTRTLGLNEVLGYKDTAAAGDVLGVTGPQSEAQRLTPGDYVGHQSGFYRSTPRVPRNILAVGTAKEGFYRDKASKAVEMFLQAAAENPSKSAHFMQMVDKARQAGVHITDPEVVKANGGVDTYYLSEEAFQNLLLRYRDPGSILNNASGAATGIVRGRLQRYENTSVDPYQALIKDAEEPGDGNQEE